MDVIVALVIFILSHAHATRLATCAFVQRAKSKLRRKTRKKSQVRNVHKKDDTRYATTMAVSLQRCFLHYLQR